MRAKKIGYFLSVLLLSSAFMFNVDASPDTTVTFRGIDVTIDITYPEEAHPNTTITYDATITANTNLTSINIGILIYAPVNSILQLIKNQPLSWGALHENESLPTSEISIPLPEQANGTLYCNMTVQTEIGLTTHYASYSFYTTRVSTLTFSEMQSLYNEMLTKYNAQVAAYQTLLDNYNKLSDDYDALNANYRSKINEYSALQKDYNDLNSTHNSLQANYTSLQADYDDLNQTYTRLLTDLNNLQTDLNNSVSELNTDRILMFIFVITLVALIAFIIYLKRGKEEPYVVIRKETVSMNQDENS